MEDQDSIPELEDDEFVKQGKEDIITLLTSDGDEVEMIEIAGIAYNGNFYVILQPKELPEGMSDEEALVFNYTKGENDEDKYSLVLEEDIVDHVFAEYNRMLDEAQAKEEEEARNRISFL